MLYYLLATPRTGSHFLCGLLRSTGLLGSPAEYLSGNDDLAGVAQICRTEPVFGIRCALCQLLEFRQVDELADVPTRYVLLERRDRLRQAISWYRADRSHVWHRWSGDAPAPAVPFDREAILHYRRQIDVDTRQTEEWLAAQGCDFVRLCYEDVVADPEAALRRLCRHVLGSVPAAFRWSLDDCPLVTADETTREWWERLETPA